MASRNQDQPAARLASRGWRMHGKSQLSAWYLRHVPTLIMLVVVSTAIAVGNLSFEYDAMSAEIERVGFNNLELSYGWPLDWYWRSADINLGSRSLQLLFSRYSPTKLATNMTVWLLTAATSVAACEWLLRRCKPHSFGRPRILTLIVLFAVAAPIVLANLSSGDCELNPPADFQCSRGWPLAWYWQIHFGMDGPFPFVLSPCSPGRLAANLAMWLVGLAVPGLVCEWLTRRYRPRLRWSLRTMLAVIGLLALCAAWCASLRDRADAQDRLIADVDAMGGAVLEMERWGPKWLGLVVADRYLRRINYARVYDGGGRGDLLERLAHSPSLWSLELWLDNWNPEIAASLGNMRQLRTLRILLRKSKDYLRNYDDDRVPDEWLAVIGKMKGLEKLDLQWSVITDDSLPYLADLTNLKTLCWTDHIRWVELVDFASRRSLSRLPSLPHLETIDFTGALIGDRDLSQLAVLPRLRSLNLSGLFRRICG